MSFAGLTGSLRSLAEADEFGIMRAGGMPTFLLTLGLMEDPILPN
jgi:hypothetical protein